jgi:NTE family protein
MKVQRSNSMVRDAVQGNRFDRDRGADFRFAGAPMVNSALMTFAAPGLPSRRRSRAATAACFGGGGAFGIAFNLGVAHALQDGGLPVGAGPMIGTSAGSWTAAALATGLTLDDLTPTWTAAGSGRRRRVIDSSTAVWGARRDGRVSGVALQVPLARRRLLSGARYCLADIVAASSSLPGFAASHVIEGRRYVDGGLVSSTSADRAPCAELLVVTAPMAGPLLGAVGTMGDRVARVETARWCLRNGRRALYVRPDGRFRPYLARLGDVMSMRRIDEVYDKAYALGTERLEIFRAREGRPFPYWAA